MRILLIEDDELLAQSMKVCLESENYVVDIANDGQSGSYIARTNKYSLIILDLILPNRNGILVCEDIRNANITTPLLILSSKIETEAKVKLLQMGADDYLTKPFITGELIARVEALTRRPYKMLNQIIQINDLTIDTQSNKVLKGDKEIYLTRKEFMLLECLGQNEGSVVTRNQLLEEVWDRNYNPMTNTLETHIRNLRKKLCGKKKNVIKTINGRGYRIDKTY